MRRSSLYGLAFVFLVAGLAAAACGGGDGDAAVAVLAASSLTEVLREVEPSARYSFGGSNQLAQQIRQGAPFDVYLAASPRYTQELYHDGLVREPVQFARNSLVLIVPKGNPADIERVEDLADRPDLRLVAAGSEVPVGAYTEAALARLGLEEVLDGAVSLEPDVKGVVGKVALGEADAGFAYTTDVATVAEDVEAISLPASAQPEVAYEAAIASDPVDPESAAAFVEALLGPAGRDELDEAGFELP